MNLIKNRKKFYMISLAIILIGLASLVTRQLNLGIDFKSGTIIEIDLQEEYATGDVRTIVNQVQLAQQPVIRSVGDGTSVQVETEPLTDEQRQEMLTKMRAEYPDLEVMRTDQVDPVFGQELARQAFLALIIASIGMVAYITWRFEFKFAITAIMALLHDVFIVLTVFSIVQIEVNSGFVAALLLIIGYSINDTIVIFDRIRENLRNKSRRDTLGDIVNTSLLQTMRRSINTSLTTLLAVGSLLILGGATLKPFALALFVGVLSGTYSSIFVASPLWVDWKNRS